MLTRAKRLWAVGMVLALCLAAACAVRLGGGGGVPPFVSFTIGSQTFTFQFGNAGVFNVRRGAEPERNGLRVENLFEMEGTPSDRPVSADLTLGQTAVRVTPLNVGKATTPLQGISGTFDVVVYLGNVDEADPCETGTNVGTVHATVTDSSVSLDTTALALPPTALTEVITGNFTVCLEVSGDIDATITITQMGVAFGPAADEPDGGDEGPTGETTTAYFTCLNQDAQDIHILLPGDDFSDDNRVAPGATKTARILDAQIGLGVVISAGRNGQILATTDCPMITQADYSATVVWDGATLTCDAEQPDESIVQVPIDQNGDAAAVTHTVNGVDYAIIGVMDVNSPETGPPAYAQTVNVDLAQLGLQYVETIYLATQSSHAWDIPNGVKVATFTCEYAEGGAPTTLDMIMGQNTAEWGFENPTQLETMGGPVSHSQPPILTTSPTTQGSDQEYDGHTFAASVSLDTTRTLASMSLELEDAQEVALTRTPPNPNFLLLAQAHMGITLQGPAGTPDTDFDTNGEGGTDYLTESVEGCWRVVVDKADFDIEYVYQFDADANLERIWRVYWDGGIVEQERYTVANLSPFFADYFSNPTQDVSFEVEGTQVTIAVTHSVVVNDYEEAVDGSCTVEAVTPLVETTTISGVVLSLASPDSFTGASYSYTWEFPDEVLPSEPATASGTRVDCPDVADPNVYSQEEQGDYCRFEPPGAIVDPD